jgi:hypothetical protein
MNEFMCFYFPKEVTMRSVVYVFKKIRLFVMTIIFISTIYKKETSYVDKTFCLSPTLIYFIIDIFLLNLFNVKTT